MTAELLIQEILNQAGDQVFSLIFRFIAIGVIIYILKLFVESLASYFLFRYNKYVGIGTKIEIYGKVGTVKHIGYTALQVDTEDGIFHIPIREWKSAKYTVLEEKIK